VETLDIKQPLLSFHLKALREAGLINDRRDGRWTYYSLDRAALRQLGAAVGGLGEPGRFRKPRVSCRP
jgi:ArsR family transcriptional regulator